MLLLVLWPASSGATSCVPLETSIHGDCENAICRRVVFVDTESGYGTCARLPVVVENSELHRRILESELAAFGMREAGTYELKLERAWYFPGYRLESIDDYRRFHRSEGTSGRYGWAASTLSRADDDAVAMTEWWRSERERARSRQRSRRLLDIAVIGVGIVPLIGSGVLWWRGVSGGDRRLQALTCSFALPVVTLAYGFAMIAVSFRFENAAASCILLALLLLVVELLLLAIVSLLRSVAARRSA